jgi:serine/threonine-protein kinase
MSYAGAEGAGGMTDTGSTSHPRADADADLAPGQRVGEYIVDKKIGQGGFGAVFKATHPLIGKEVAIKVLARKLSADEEMVSRFVAEASAVNKIRSRHIIEIFAFNQLEDGRWYYVMELLEGESLDEMIDRGPVPIGAAIPILGAIAKALDAAHAKGIAHRDIKAENIFLVRETDGTLFPKLLDFGIAKLLGAEEQLKHKTRTGAPIGTPYYMSPEQCRGRDVDHRTDIYAFGVLTYLMLTGAYPHDGDDYMDILMKQISNEPLPPSKLAELPWGTDDAVLWMMTKDPAQRPPNLTSAVHALDVAAQSAGVTIVNGPRSMTWDVQSSPLAMRYATPPPAALPRMSSVVGAQHPVGHASTMPPPSAAPQPIAHPDTLASMSAPALAASQTMAPPPAARSRGLIIGIAALAAAAIGVTVFLAVGRSKEAAPLAPPPATAAQPAPAATQPPTPAPTPTPTPAVVTPPTPAAVVEPPPQPAVVPADAAVAPPPSPTVTEPVPPVPATTGKHHGNGNGHHHGNKHPSSPGHDDIEEAFPSQ